ncbi:MAG: hypothetical protein MJ223_00015 [Mycoplasmoidaceae bacterium]|nr:hypothetical protein [Mycoplasmoidaceae bacterium]
MGRGGSQAQRVRKGQRMSGHYGCELVTIQNLQVLFVNDADNTMTIFGAIPGPANGVVFIKNSVKRTKPVIPPVIITKENMEAVQEKNEKLQDKEAVKQANEAMDKADAAKAEAEKREKEAAAQAKKEQEKAAAKASGKPTQGGK